MIFFLNNFMYFPFFKQNNVDVAGNKIFLCLLELGGAEVANFVVTIYINHLEWLV